jgi:hypothetical protein
MWKRSDLKRNAKTALKANYLKCMLAGIILLFAAGSQTIGGSSTSTVQDTSDAYYQSLALMDGTQNSENPVLNDTLYLNTDGELTPDGYQAIYAQAEGLIQDPSLRMLRRFVMGPMQVIWDSISGFLGGAASLLLMLLGILVLDPIGYDIENLSRPEIRKKYHGPITTDHYGRQVPKHGHGTQNLKKATASTRLLMEAAEELFDRIVNPELLIRRITITANHVVRESEVQQTTSFEQLDLFTDYDALEKQRKEEDAELEKEKKMQQAMLSIKKKFGKNAILKGMNLEEGAMARERNDQIGGHKA